MKIVFDHVVDCSGEVVALHHIDTTDPQVQAMLKTCKDDILAQMNAGYLEPTLIKEHIGKTRWQVIIHEAVRLDDAIARTILEV